MYAAAGSIVNFYFKNMDAEVFNEQIRVTKSSE